MSQRSRITILPSPLLPPTAYERLIEGLGATGATPSVADPSLSRSQTADDLVLRWSRDLSRTDLLVAHSNAGYLAPHVRARVDGRTPIVFVDAALLPEAGESRLAPASFRTHLAGLADEHGVLPPWTRWWPRETLAGVVPDELYAEIDSGCPRLALRYFDHRLAAPKGWAAGANAYLAFGDTYAPELDFARQRGWPTRVTDGKHLHFVHEPAAVAHEILALARQLWQRDR